MNRTELGLGSANVVIRDHPGYYGARDWGECTTHPRARPSFPPAHFLLPPGILINWIAFTARQFEDYSGALKSTKILLTDSAWVHYSVQKYSEAVVAGALMVGDIPHDRMREYRCDWHMDCPQH